MMRPLQLSLIGLGVLAAITLSVFLVLRNLPAESPHPAQEQMAAPEQNAAPKQAAQDEPVSEPTAPAPPAPSDTSPPPPLVEPLIVKPAGSQASAFDPLILPPSGLSGGSIAALPRTQQSTPAERTASLPAGTRLSLSEAQEEKIRYVLQSHNIIQTEVTDFPLRPGGSVPKEVHLTPLPIELANVVPNYRSYSYVFAQDRILIVVTNSREIGLVLSM